MKSLIKPGIYRHYKGQDYEVVGTARHSESEEDLVLYFPLYGDANETSYWVRPLTMFTEEVSANGKVQPRFALLDQEN